MGNLVQLIRGMVQEELSEMAAPAFSIKVLDQGKAERLKNLHSGHWVGELIDLIIKSGDNGTTRNEIATALDINPMKLNDEIKALQDNGIVSRGRLTPDKPEKTPGQRGRKSSDKSRAGVVRTLFQNFKDNPEFTPSEDDITYDIPKGLGTEKLSDTDVAKIKSSALGLTKRGRPKMQKESLYEAFKRLQNLKNG